MKRYKEAISDCEWALRVSKTQGKRSEKCPLIFQCHPKQRVSHPSLSGVNSRLHSAASVELDSCATLENWVEVPSEQLQIVFAFGKLLES